MAVDLDFSGVERGGPVPEGEYTLLIESVEKKRAKNGDSDILTVYYTIMDEDYNGRRIVDTVSLHPKALWSARIWLEAIVGEEIDGPFSFEEEALVGQVVGAMLVDNTYNGNTYSKPSKYFPAT